MFAGLPKNWDMMEMSTRFIEMMPRLSSLELTNTRKCHKCGKVGHVASICRKFNDSTKQIRPIETNPKEENFCQCCFLVTGNLKSF